MLEVTSLVLFAVGLVLGGVVGHILAFLIVLGVLHLTEDWRISKGWL